MINSSTLQVVTTFSFTLEHFHPPEGLRICYFSWISVPLPSLPPSLCLSVSLILELTFLVAHFQYR